MLDGTTGFLVEKGNHEQLIEKIELLLTDKELSEQMGEKGREFIENTFSWKIITNNFPQL